MKHLGSLFVVGGLTLPLLIPQPLKAAEKVDFEKDIKVILEATCLSCHGEKKPKGDLRLDTKAEAMKGGEYGPVIVVGKPEKSTLYTTTILDPDDDEVMPPKGDPLTTYQTDLLKRWIAEGANWPDNVTLTQVRRINFAKDIQPIFETSCVSCHREDQEKGGLRMDTLAALMKGGDNGAAIVPGQPDKSLLYELMTLSAEDDDVMPPAKKGGPLPKESVDLVRDWILQGAYFPPDLVLTPRKEEVASDGGTGEAALVKRIHWKIVTNLTMNLTPSMAAYTNQIDGSRVSYAMVPIPGGEYTMGSPEGEAKRKKDEGPQHKVKIEPFWMGRTEVTWNEFELFMYPEEERKIRDFLGYLPDPENPSHGVTRPTAPYVEMSFGMGKDDYPAISMTQHAANKYCQWLSAKTGHFYRLPTEAEWEYACRAGTTTAYSFGDDPSKLGEYAWFFMNSNDKYQKVGVKKPNPWGLYDMHGNVMEWCLDQYDPEMYKQGNGKVVFRPWNKATKPYPHVARGGSWYDDPELLRSASRVGSHEDWKMQDPQIPKSIWYHTDAQFLGFRIIRPLKVPTPEELESYWNSGVENELD